MSKTGKVEKPVVIELRGWQPAPTVIITHTLVRSLFDFLLRFKVGILNQQYLVSCILICCKMERMGHIFTLQSLLQVNSSKHHHCSLTRTPEGNQRCPRFYSDHGTTTSTNSSSSELSQFVKDWRRGLTTQRSQQLLLNPQAPTAPTCET